MRVAQLKAVPDPAGNRIHLHWKIPAGFDGVRVMRRAGTFPTRPDDGVLVAEGTNLQSAEDSGLKSETVYYYMLFPYQGDPPAYAIDLHNRVATLATGPYDFAGWMYSLLPAIYHRYDTSMPSVIPSGMSPLDRTRGQLRRFLDLPGGQLDQWYSSARAMLSWRSPDKLDGRLLPRLAEWIGWKTDYRLEIEAQRNEIRNAPAIYRSLQIIPTVEATVKRVSGWESRSKEFVHNVFASNRPEQLNLWWQRRPNGGAWAHESEPLSLDFSYEGRPASVRGAAGKLWFIYHTQRRGHWSLWVKTFETGTGWSASQPLTNTAHTDKHPSVVLAGGSPWVFWNRYEPSTQRWQILHATWAGNHWSEPLVFPPVELGLDPNPARKRPSALVDSNGHVWLFWMEKQNANWQLRYSRHDGANWGAPVDFPLDGGNPTRVEAEPFVMFQDSASGPRLWVWWSRRLSGGTQWEVAYRYKENLTLDAANWTGVQVLAKDALDPQHHDREAFAVINSANELEVFWSSNRGDQGWRIYRSRPTNLAATTWEVAQAVTDGPYSARDPLACVAATQTWLLYRSNRPVQYRSTIYGATETYDLRYAGATSVSVRNRRKLSLRGALQDFSTYSYDTGLNGTRNNDNWYARDTLGLYLSTDTLETDAISAGVDRLENVMDEFLPITDRAVFIPQTDQHTDYVYDYGVLGRSTPYYIAETYTDVLSQALSESALGPGEDFDDSLE